MSYDLPVDGDAEVLVSAPLAPPDWTFSLTLRNPTSEPRVFKCKTTAPRRWSVRPNGGVLDPGESVVLSVRVVLRTTQQQHHLDGIEDDRHLILNVAVTPDEAVALRERRESSPRSSLVAALQPDSPGVGLLRLTPAFEELPVSDGTGPAPQQSGLTSPSGLSTQTMQSPMQSPMPSPAVSSASPTAPASAAVDDRHRGSVADRVAELDRKYAPPAAAPAHGAGSLRDGASGEEGSGGEGGGGGTTSVVVRSILSALEALLEEFSPWLSWKVYDVLFAVFLLLLGRRVKWIRDAQETLGL